MNRTESPGAALARLRWASGNDGRNDTSQALAALDARFAQAADPDEARREHYRTLQRRSVEARRANAARRGAA